jgi:hypothetical protein
LLSVETVDVLRIKKNSRLHHVATLLKHLTHSHLPGPELKRTLPGIAVLKIRRSCITISYTAANTTANNTKHRMIHH